MSHQYAYFTTREGEEVYRTQSRWAAPSSKRAMQKARALGYDTLLAHEPGREQPVDYTALLNRNQNGAT